jgi:hypothetical protein
MMTEPNRSLDELPALIAERKKFEAWISALDGRRANTAPHVFERVQTDYFARLREVDERLAAHRSAILEEKTSLVSRRSLLEAEEQMRRDERAELELRAHVGELVGDESETAFGSVDEALAKMGEERNGLTKRIEELDVFLNLPGREAAAASSSEKEPPSKAPTPAASGMPVGGQGIAGDGTSAPSATPVDVSKLVLSEESATFQKAGGQIPDIDEVLAEPASDSGMAASQPQTTKGQRLTPGGTFDELAFLSDVVGLKPNADTAVPPPVVPASKPSLRDEPQKSPLEGMTSSRPSTATPPLASNVGNTPIVLRASGAISQSKTLKCTECGAMNYPTEWYCERCGAELAAL